MPGQGLLNVLMRRLPTNIHPLHAQGTPLVDMQYWFNRKDQAAHHDDHHITPWLHQSFTSFSIQRSAHHNRMTSNLSEGTQRRFFSIPSPQRSLQGTGRRHSAVACLPSCLAFGQSPWSDACRKSCPHGALALGLGCPPDPRPPGKPANPCMPCIC